MRDELRERLAQNRAFVYVRRRATPAQAKRVAALELDGIAFRKESKRFYPNRELAAHVLGYVGVDNVGLGGLEATYDKTVRGREGKLLVQTDARRHVFSRLERSPTTGASIELTIDEHLQHIAEREVRAGVEAARADGGTAVVMDPHTGEILAMASWPTFNPNDYADAPEAARRNRAVQDLYEPGSTFKLVTASAALQEKVVTPDDIIDTSGGVIKFPRPQADHRHGPRPRHAVVHRRDRQVEQRRRDQGRPEGRRRAHGPLHPAFRLRPPVVAGLSRREPGHRLGLRRS